MHEQFELGYNIPRIVSATQFETGVVPEGGALIVLDEIQACGGHRWEDGRNRIGAPPHQLRVVADSYPRCQKQHSMV